MRSTISSAISKNDIIILDGSKGDFVISSSMSLSNLKNRTIVGINDARLTTQFYLTQELKDSLDAAGVMNGSTASGTGGKLSTGTAVDEEREFLTRQTLINVTGDKTEAYRKAGILTLDKCSNIIIRNIKFVGPGPCDVGGYDLISSTATTHLWVDHCEFTDGIDGNFDITKESDFITVSWCTFAYTDRAYDHKNTNLVGSSDSSTADRDKLNITFAYNIWGEGCNQRMPMARFGTIHLLNNYYACPGASLCVNARKESEMLIEGNYFEGGVKNVFSQSSATAYVFLSNYYAYYSNSTHYASKGTVSIPYAYDTLDPKDVPSTLTAADGAGATLADPLSFEATTSADRGEAIKIALPVGGEDKTGTYNILGQKVNPGTKGLVISGGKLIFRR